MHTTNASHRSRKMSNRSVVSRGFAWCNGWLWARLIVLSATMDGRLGDSLGVGGCGGIMVASTAGMGFYGRHDRSYGATIGLVMKVRRLLSLEAPGRSGTGTDNMFIFAGKYI
ncbi:hypothetical protein D6D05_07802 [Aureobasidium pullulans]|nr:hypothetical protein D6D05_07802 [Aureobasidium pullulans]